VVSSLAWVCLPQLGTDLTGGKLRRNLEKGVKNTEHIQFLLNDDLETMHHMDLSHTMECLNSITIIKNE
jgi:hypothetical protein